MVKLASGILLCFLTGFTCAQEELTPLILDWNDTTRTVEERLQTAKDLHITFHQTYPDTVLFYLEEMRALAERHDLPIELYSAHNRIGTLSQILGRNEAAFAAFGDVVETDGAAPIEINQGFARRCNGLAQMITELGTSPKRSAHSV